MTAAFTAMAIAQEQATPSINLDKLIQLAGQLVELLKQENDYLTDHDLKGAATLTSRKNQLTADYAKLQTVANENPKAFDAADPEKKTMFQSVLDELRKILVLNERALRMAITAGERIVRHVKEAVQVKRANVGGYTAEGQYTSRSAQAQPLPALYNKAI